MAIFYVTWITKVKCNSMYVRVLGHPVDGKHVHTVSILKKCGEGMVFNH
jgi:hypothetical protein